MGPNIDVPYVSKHYAILPSSDGDRFNFINTDSGEVIRLNQQELDTIYDHWEVASMQPPGSFDYYLSWWFRRLKNK